MARGRTGRRGAGRVHNGHAAHARAGDLRWAFQAATRDAQINGFLRRASDAGKGIKAAYRAGGRDAVLESSTARTELMRIWVFFACALTVRDM